MSVIWSDASKLALLDFAPPQQCVLACGTCLEWAPFCSGWGLPNEVPACRTWVAGTEVPLLDWYPPAEGRTAEVGGLSPGRVLGVALLGRSAVGLRIRLAQTALRSPPQAAEFFRAAGVVCSHRGRLTLAARSVEKKNSFLHEPIVAV